MIYLFTLGLVRNSDPQLTLFSNFQHHPQEGNAHKTGRSLACSVKSGVAQIFVLVIWNRQERGGLVSRLIS